MRVAFASLALLSLVSGCGGGGSEPPPPPPSPPPPAQASIASLEQAGRIPRLDRSESLSGPDTNANGIRDDIDQFIAVRPDSAPQKEALSGFARGLQASLSANVTDQEETRRVALQITRSINCVFSRYPSAPTTASTALDEIQAITANTRIRLEAYLAYNRALDGSVAAIPEGDSCVAP